MIQQYPGELIRPRTDHETLMAMGAVLTHLVLEAGGRIELSLEALAETWYGIQAAANKVQEGALLRVQTSPSLDCYELTCALPIERRSDLDRLGAPGSYDLQELLPPAPPEPAPDYDPTQPFPLGRVARTPL